MVSLVDTVLEGIKRSLDWFTSLLFDGLRSGYNTLTAEAFGTPTPRVGGSTVFGEPTNAPWSTIRDALVGGEIMLVALLILVVSVQTRHAIHIFNIGSAYAAQRVKKTSWTGALLIVSWYWIGALTLYLVDGFTIALLPTFSSVSTAMVELLSASISNPVLAFLIGAVGGFSMWALQALLYIRRILLYVYLYGMPIAFALAFGQIPVLSTIAIRFCRRFVPLVILPLPSAIVFKGYDILYTSGSVQPDTPFLGYLISASLPLVALFVSWRTFKYATPLTSKAVAGTAKGATLLGGVTVGAYAGGAGVATTAARWGPKAAVGHEIARRATERAGSSRDEDSSPSYRRTENDSGGN
jgi:type IV secretion system protein TrbL